MCQALCDGGNGSEASRSDELFGRLGATVRRGVQHASELT